MGRVVDEPEAVTAARAGAQWRLNAVVTRYMLSSWPLHFEAATLYVRDCSRAEGLAWRLVLRPSESVCHSTRDYRGYVWDPINIPERFIEKRGGAPPELATDADGAGAGAAPFADAARS
jgi:hypothetical protein